MPSLSGTSTKFRWLKIGWLIPALFLYASGTTVLAEDYTSTDFTVRDPVIGSSNDSSSATSSSFQVQGASGQAAVGQSSSSSFSDLAGNSSDDTPPLAGTVNDGSGADIDSQTDMTTLEANWSGFSDPDSGIKRYEYSITREADNSCWNNTTQTWDACSVWNDNGLPTSISLNSGNLALRTGTRYTVCVRAVNNVLLKTTVCSNGFHIDPSMTFSYDASSVNLPVLNSGNNWDSIATSTLTVDTNAYNGYSVYGSKKDLMKTADGSQSIPDIDDGYCGGVAAAWPGPTHFGFSSSDSVDHNKFHTGGTKYCAFPTTSNPTAGIKVVDVSAPISGGSVVNTNTITYRTQADVSQPAGKYHVTILYTVLPRF